MSDSQKPRAQITWTCAVTDDDDADDDGEHAEETCALIGWFLVDTLSLSQGERSVQLALALAGCAPKPNQEVHKVVN